MKKFFLSVFFFFLIGFGIFGIFSLKIIPEYNFDVSENILTSHQNHFEFSSENQKNIWYIGIDKNFIEQNFPEKENFCAEFALAGKIFHECLDVEHSDDTDKYYSFPLATDVSDNISIQLWYKNLPANGVEKISLYSMNTLPTGKKLSFEFSSLVADSQIISRSAWGADENLRYRSHPKHMANYQRNLENQKKPKTEAQLKNIQKNADINAFIKEKLGSDFETTSLIRTENWNQLVWPIQKVKKVNKIIIHHTADKLDGRSDEELLRAIYSYHSTVRWWGDIGYNYIVGQNGKIYEGRAGGDYVVAAHAAYNNIGSVGISVLWDYENSSLNSLQELSLKNLIAQVSQKYGINVNSYVMGFRACKTSTCYPLETVYTRALLGHKDVGVTSCPGKNIYNLLPTWRAELSAGYTPILNTKTGIIEPQIETKNSVSPTLPITPQIQNSPLQNQLLRPQLQITPSVSNNLTPTQNSVSPNFVNNRISQISYSDINQKYDSQKFRVKLSYPNYKNIEISAFWNISSSAVIDGISYEIKPSEKIFITLGENNFISVKIAEKNLQAKNFSLSSGLVEINSWDRIPLWDTLQRYNDNLFRDTIEIYNNNWQFAVINHLPMEFYLKWLGEVSNTDLPEKIKTITVAARWYATFYMQKENRKYATDRYDGSDDPDSFQKYLWYSYEMRSSNVSKMVDQTAWEIIYLNGKIIKPWYFSRSDGRTLSYLEYCQKNSWKNCENISYLQSVSDPAWNGMTRSGHWVGISGIGATDFASKGWNYKQIIQYYLNGVEIRK